MLILSLIAFGGCFFMYFKCDSEQRKVILAIMSYVFGLYCLSGV